MSKNNSNPAARWPLLLAMLLIAVAAVVMRPWKTSPPVTTNNPAASAPSSVAVNQPVSAATPAPATGSPAAARTASAGVASQSGAPLAGAIEPGPASATPLAAAPQAGAMLVPGEPVHAQVTVTGRTLALEPNQVGAFPRVHITPGQTVAVTAQWPEAGAGARVVAAEEDGGLLNDSQKVLALNLDGSGRANFNFTAGQGAGIYRVTLRHGPDAKTLDLWVDADLAQAR